MNDAFSPLAYLFLTGLFALVVFLVLRQLALWYWRVNEIADSVIYIARHFQRIDAEAGRQRIEETRRTTGTQTVGSPFVPMGIRKP